MSIAYRQLDQGLQVKEWRLREVHPKGSTFTAVQVAHAEGVNPKIARRRSRDAAKLNSLMAVRLHPKRWVFAATAPRFRTKSLPYDREPMRRRANAPTHSRAIMHDNTETTMTRTLYDYWYRFNTCPRLFFYLNRNHTVAMGYVVLPR